MVNDMYCPNYIIKWTELSDGVHVRTFLRRLSLDGEYFGEVQDVLHGSQRTISGVISADCVVTLRNLLSCFYVDKPPLPGSVIGWDGMLAVGDVTMPTILFYYRFGDEVYKDLAVKFIALIELLRAQGVTSSN